MAKGNGKTKEKVIRLDERVDLILSNHIPHIQADIKELRDDMKDAHTKIDGIKEKLAYISGKNVAVAAIIFYAIDILINHYLK